MLAILLVSHQYYKAREKFIHLEKSEEKTARAHVVEFSPFICHNEAFAIGTMKLLENIIYSFRYSARGRSQWGGFDLGYK